MLHTNKPCFKCGKNARAIMNRKKGTVHSWCNPCIAAKERKYRSENREWYSKLQKKYQRQRKQKVIDHYGGKCACCGETLIEFLSMDHVLNNGAEHRRQIHKEYGNKHIGGTNLYKWIIKHNFPEKIFRVLCFNCNASIGFYGYCPHVKVGSYEGKHTIC